MGRENRGVSSSWRLFRLALVSLLLVAPSAARAEPIAEKNIPAPLEPWVPWVLGGVPDSACVVISSETVCVWPGKLELSLDEGGGSFELEVATDRPSFVPLPGSKTTWPGEVRVGGKPAVVLSRAGVPQLRLAAGVHRVSGRFSWEKLPETIPVPALVARVGLKVLGRSIAHPKRNQDGSLWLRSSADKSDEPERLELEVFRRLDDAVPLKVTTHLALRVSGRAREVDLGQVMLPGSVPMALESSLPLRLDAEGRLFAQVRAGRHSLKVIAVYPEPPAKLQLSKRPAPWPQQETWVWVPNPSLRQVDLSGAPGVDPKRTNLPEDWQSLEAYNLKAPGALEFVTRRRGEPEPPPNKLSLRRELWLDTDGGGYTVQDRLSGKMQQGWRLDLVAGSLGHAKLKSGDQLITRAPGSDAGGVELRASRVDLTAEWRLASGSDLPAVGWSEDVQSLNAVLNLPPGWQVLASRGVDQLPNTWIGAWDLFDVFFVLVVALAFARVGRWWWGLLALAGLVSSHDVSGTPYWVWVSLLVSTGLLGVLEAGWLRNLVRIYWLGSTVTLLVVFLTFAVTQVRGALYPHVLDQPDDDVYMSEQVEEVEDNKEGGTGARAKGDEGSMSGRAFARKAKRYSSVSETSNLAPKKAPRQQALQQQDPQAVIQTGPGIPDWKWQRWSLHWNGPVDRNHRMHLYLLSPLGSGVLRLFSVLLLGLLGLLVIRRSPIDREPPAGKAEAKSGQPLASAAAAALLCLLATSLVPATAEAQTPTKELLEELQKRLTRGPDCADECVTVPRLRVEVRDSSLSLEAEVHVGAPAAYKLPGPAASWVPAEVSVDGKSSSRQVRLKDGFLHLRLEPGVHQVRLVGPISGDDLTLTLGEPALFARVDAPGWQVDGVRDDGQVEKSIQLSRTAKQPSSGAPEDEAAATKLPPWLTIERRLEVGVTWTLQTTVTRVSPTGSPIVLRFPLLPREEVTRADLLVEKGHAVVTLGRDDKTLTWESALEPGASLELTAPKGQPWSEIWTIQCGVVWHCSSAGVAPLKHTTDGQWAPVFRPWPGERLRLSFTRPPPAVGSSSTVELADLTLTPGTRRLLAQLLVVVKSSSGSSQIITLPDAEAKVQELKVDGKAQPIRRDGEELSVSLRPGKQTIEVVWQQPGGLETVFRAPQVLVGGQVANAQVTVKLPRERWLLFAGGPRWGPAILFWGYVVLILVLSLILGRLKQSPLRSWQWGLLALGLTQVPAVVVVIIASWYFLLEYRRSWLVENRYGYNAAQVGLILWTLVFLSCLVAAVYAGLVSHPDMEVEGNLSTNSALRWYADRVGNTMPTPWVLSTSIWVWRVAMLGWALWLAWNLIKWLRWAWESFTLGGAFRPLYVPSVAAAAPVDDPGADEPEG